MSTAAPSGRAAPLARRASGRLAVWAAVAAASGLAWAALAAWGTGPGGAHDHGSLLADPQRAALALAAWALMPVAMMLPTALPLLDRFARVVQRRPDRLALAGLVAAGFLGIWTLSGAALLGGVDLLHGALDRVGPLAERPGLLGGLALAGAGAYQFSALKERCLTACRSPAGILYRRWGAGREARRALAIGADHGRSCLGCCWALMLLMGAVGLASPGWMLALTAAMGIEKNASWGSRLTLPLGVVLVVVGIAVAALALSGSAGAHH